MLRIARTMWYWEWYHSRPCGENVDPEMEDAAEIRRIHLKILHQELTNMLAEVGEG